MSEDLKKDIMRASERLSQVTQKTSPFTGDLRGQNQSMICASVNFGNPKTLNFARDSVNFNNPQSLSESVDLTAGYKAVDSSEGYKGVDSSKSYKGSDDK